MTLKAKTSHFVSRTFDCHVSFLAMLRLRSSVYKNLNLTHVQTPGEFSVQSPAKEIALPLCRLEIHYYTQRTA